MASSRSTRAPTPASWRDRYCRPHREESMSLIRDRWLTRRRFLGLAGATASMAWARRDARAATAVGPKQTFVYAMGADPTNLDPHSTTDGLAIVAMHRCYDKLL